MNIRAAIKTLIMAGSMTCIALMAGCGGGGGSTPVTSVKGTGAKGIIFPGTVKLYGVDASGVKGSSPLATVSTASSGKYTAELGSYAGPLVVEVSGTYTDEATGSATTISPLAPLHAVVDVVDNGSNNNRTVAVTPLTELAYSLVGTTITAPAVIAANKRVGELFKITDITGTEPVAATATAMAGATIPQQTYTIALATLSQMAKDSAAGANASFDQIKSLLTSFGADLAVSAGSGLSTAKVTAFAAALATVTASTTFSGFDTAAAALASAGTTVARLTLAAANVPSGVQLGGLKVTLTLPAGVSVRADKTGRVLADMIMPTGTTAAGTVQVMGNYQATTRTLVISLVSTTGFGSGDCAIVTFDIATGANLSAANLAVTVNEAKDAGPTYGPVAGVTAAFR